MPKYVATFRASFDAPDDATAAIIADQIQLNGGEDLDDDEGDTFEVTQVTSNHLELEPTELRTQLTKLRNVLIRMRTSHAIDIAKQLDQYLYALQFSDPPEFVMGGYDHDKFMDAVIAIIKRGEEPDVG